MIYIKQPTIEAIIDLEIDIFIAASGFETRATFQSIKLHSNAKQKFVFGFKNEIQDRIRMKNDTFFKKHGFASCVINGDESTITQFHDILNEIENISNEEIIVYIDYSCMTKNWYSYLLYGFFNLDNKKNIKLYFGYSHATFEKSKDSVSLNRIVSPLYGFCDFSVPSKPTALIIGLGNEINRVYGLKEYFDAVPYLFYSDSSYNEKYCEEIETLNNDILEKTKADQIFKFPIYDLIYTNFLLENLCLSLTRDFRVIIAPCGPKPFALLSMINSLKNDLDIEVWRISPGTKINKVDRKPTGLISVLELSFTG